MTWSSAGGQDGLNFSSGRSAIDDRAGPQPIRLVLILLLTVSLWGCPLRWQRVSVNDVITPEDIAFIVPGTTSFREVVSKLGAPDELSESHLGPVTHYHFRDLKYFRVNFGYALKWFTPPGLPDDMVLSGGGMGTEELLVFYDDRWIVRGQTFAHHLNASQYRAWPFGSPSDD
jgi:hypothetical protein